MRLSCHKVSPGIGKGPALVSTEPISFLGNVDPDTGIVVDPSHQLFGKCISGKVLIFPGGKGSTVGSYVIYQLARRNVAPVAMINVRTEPIVAVGAIISGIPLVDDVSDEILDIPNDTPVTVDADAMQIIIGDG